MATGPTAAPPPQPPAAHHNQGNHAMTTTSQQDQPSGEGTQPPGQPSGPAPPGPAPAAACPPSGQQQAYRVLGQLLDDAAAHNLPPLEWRIAAFAAHLTGRCTAYPGPHRRRGDFEAWCTHLGARTTEDTPTRQIPRLTARAEHGNSQITIEIIADLYDDPDVPLPSSAPQRTWRTP